MKIVRNTFLLFLGIVFSVSLFADEKKKKVTTIEFSVSGVCDMCEKRIENAALIKGVKMAEWDKHEQKIKVVYRPDKTDEGTIHRAIAKVGHDTDKVKASAEAYNKLHECCKYREGHHIH